MLSAYDQERFQTARYILEIQEACWSSFLQSVVSLLVIGVMAIMVISGVITAEAGLAIIGAIGGAAVGRSGVFSRAQQQTYAASRRATGNEKPLKQRSRREIQRPPTQD
jgi:hypothetical protein